MKNLLLIDGVGDFSLIQEQYKLIVPDTKLLYLGGICKELGVATSKYLDARNNNFTRNYLIDSIISDNIDTVVFSTDQDNLAPIYLLELEKLKGVTIILLTQNSFPKPEISPNSNYNFFLFDEKQTMKNNALAFLKMMDSEITVNKWSENICYCDYELIEDISKYTIGLNLGTGCSMD